MRGRWTGDDDDDGWTEDNDDGQRKDGDDGGGRDKDEIVQVQDFADGKNFGNLPSAMMRSDWINQ